MVLRSARRLSSSRHTSTGHYRRIRLGTGVIRLDVLIKLDVRPIKIVPATNPIERINALRMMLARSRFDAVKCRVGLKALCHYRREWNAAAEVFRPNPVHDWSSHGSDAASHLAIGLEEKPKMAPTPLRPRPVLRAGNSS
ncbi:MAG: phage terminase large subunit [Ilumatobacteraceae bacterium]